MSPILSVCMFAFWSVSFNNYTSEDLYLYLKQPYTSQEIYTMKSKINKRKNI